MSLFEKLFASKYACAAHQLVLLGHSLTRYTGSVFVNKNGYYEKVSEIPAKNRINPIQLVFNGKPYRNGMKQDLMKYFNTELSTIESFLNAINSNFYKVKCENDFASNLGCYFSTKIFGVVKAYNKDLLKNSCNQFDFDKFTFKQWTL